MPAKMVVLHKLQDSQCNSLELLVGVRLLDLSCSKEVIAQSVVA